MNHWALQQFYAPQDPVSEMGRGMLGRGHLCRHLGLPNTNLLAQL